MLLDRFSSDAFLVRQHDRVYCARRRTIRCALRRRLNLGAQDLDLARLTTAATFRGAAQELFDLVRQFLLLSGLRRWLLRGDTTRRRARWAPEWWRILRLAGGPDRARDEEYRHHDRCDRRNHVAEGGQQWRETHE
jgi:hypothetical protein